MIQNKWHLKIYSELKNKKESNLILKEIDQALMDLIFSFFKLTILGFPKSEQELAGLLKDDLVLLETRRDLTFVTQLLVPLLNAE